MKVLLGIVLLRICFWADFLWAAEIEVLAQFERPGSQAMTPLLAHSGGGFYGATVAGGEEGLGTIYTLDGSGDLSVLYSFSGGDGALPIGALAEGSDGKIYGTTSAGGNGGFGVVFSISTSGEFAVLAHFTGEAGAAKGAVPSGLIGHSDGDFYGVTQAGGINNAGTVYRISKAGLLTTLAEFSGSDGAGPLGELAVLGTELFGVTQSGGTSGKGSVFKVPLAGGLTSLFSFGGGNGEAPAGGLHLHSDGNFYGTTEFGGATGFGTAFRISSTGLFTMLRSFDDPGGSQPAGVLLEANGGKLYGVASAGGSKGRGGVFEMTSGGAYTLLESFTGEDGLVPGAFPRVGLLDLGTGVFRGVTSAGGPNQYGTVFDISSGGVYQSVADFSLADGWFPSGAPLWDNAGSFLFPVSEGGAGGGGGIVSVDGSGGVTMVGALGDDPGAQPDGKLLKVGVSYYGVAGGGGATGRGAGYRYTPGGGIEKFVDQTTAIGASGEGGFVRGGDGAFYAVAMEGGSSGLGTFYKVGSNGARLRLISFTGVGGSARGERPRGPVVLASNAAFYGVTEKGGVNGVGTVFRVSALGEMATLVDFEESGPRAPRGGLVIGSGGVIYGTTSAGGAADAGTIFSIVPGSGEISVVGEFPGGDGHSPVGELYLGQDGAIYGMTEGGGVNDAGVMFRYHPSLGLNVLADLGTVDGRGQADDGSGREIHGGIGEDGNGEIYGVFPAGGSMGGGAFFRLIPGRPESIEEWKLDELGSAEEEDTGDFDGDGISNLLEYALLTNPGQREESGLPFVESTDDHLGIEIGRDPLRGDVNIFIEVSSDLSPGSWSVIATSLGGAPFAGSALISGDGPSDEVKQVRIAETAQISGGQSFMRVRVERNDS